MPNERQRVRERLLREAQSAGILSHPNIVTVYDVLEEEDYAYIVMEFVPGESLASMLQRSHSARYLHTSRLLTAGCRRARLRASQRNYSPRYQAGEHHHL